MFGWRTSRSSVNNGSSSASMRNRQPIHPNDATSVPGPRLSSESSASFNTTYSSSSGTHSPSTLAPALMAWRDANSAEEALDRLQSVVNNLKRRLASEHTTAQTLKDQNSVLFKRLRTDRTCEREFQRSYDAGVQAEKAAEMTAAQLISARSERDQMKALAESSDECFNCLRNIAETMFPPNRGISSELRKASELLQVGEEGVTQASQHHADFERACQSAQKTHELHMLVIDLCESAKEQQRKANGSFRTLAQIGVRHEFTAALESSVGARTCLEECLRLLGIHASAIPQSIATAVYRLRTLGVGQIVDICDLLYGSRRGEANSKSTIQLLEQQQKEALGHITTVAVWLQDHVPEVAAATQQARIRRRLARQDIVSIWKDELLGHRGQQSTSTPSGSSSISRGLPTTQAPNQQASVLSPAQRPASSASPPSSYTRGLELAAASEARTSFESSLLFSQLGPSSSRIATDSRTSVATDASDSPTTSGGPRWANPQTSTFDRSSPGSTSLLQLPPIMEQGHEHGSSSDRPGASSTPTSVASALGSPPAGSQAITPAQIFASDPTPRRASVSSVQVEQYDPTGRRRANSRRESLPPPQPPKYGETFNR